MGRARLKQSSTTAPATDAAGDTTDDDDGRVGLLVADSCPPLIREVHSYPEDDVGAPGADDHCLDARRNAVMGTIG